MFYAKGYNKYNTGPGFQTIHAEHDAINNLPFIKNKNKKKVDVLIFRTCKKGKSNKIAAPCIECQKRLYFDIEKKGYTLNKVYYTNTDTNDLSYIKKSDLCID